LLLRPFTSDDVALAGVLLSSRHARHRQVEPLLSASYEDPEAAKAEVQRAWSSDGASGSVAESGGGMVGFLIGAPKADETWGANVWVEAAGQAVSEPEVIRDLYGHAAATWVEQGRTAHYTLVPSHDRQLVDAWFRLGFGQQHMHAVREADMGPGIARSSVTVRPARRDDISKLAELELALPQHHGLSPVFSAGKVPSLDQTRSEWEEDFEDPAFVPFVAEHSGEVIGSAIGCSIEKSTAHVGLSRPDRAGFLAFAAIFPQYRGLGAGRALGETVVRWAGAAGYPSVVTDWRVTNLLSSRTWPRLGFRDTFVRLHRVVGY
jgi:ribosomal protein S18 acetylase RimI-like enzyme